MEITENVSSEVTSQPLMAEDTRHSTKDSTVTELAEKSIPRMDTSLTSSKSLKYPAQKLTEGKDKPNTPPISSKEEHLVSEIRTSLIPAIESGSTNKDFTRLLKIVHKYEKLSQQFKSSPEVMKLMEEATLKLFFLSLRLNGETPDFLESLTFFQTFYLNPALEKATTPSELKALEPFVSYCLSLGEQCKTSPKYDGISKTAHQEMAKAYEKKKQSLQTQDKPADTLISQLDQNIGMSKALIGHPGVNQEELKAQTATLEQKKKWATRNKECIVKHYEQALDTHGNLKTGVCFMNSVRRFHQLESDPKVSSKEVEMGSTRQTRFHQALNKRQGIVSKPHALEVAKLTHELENIKAKFESEKKRGASPATLRALQNQYLEKTKLYQAAIGNLNRATKKYEQSLQRAYRSFDLKKDKLQKFPCEGNLPQQLSQAIDTSIKEGKTQVLLEVSEKHGSHAVNLQFDEKNQKFRICDDNAGVLEFDSLDSMKQGLDFFSHYYSDTKSFSLHSFTSLRNTSVGA